MDGTFGRARDESGAVAVIVALLLIVLVGMAAFVLDFGAAYSNRARLQTSADAAALAAAGELSERGATCPVAGSDATAAANEAVEVMEANHPGASDVGGLDVSCTTPGLEGQVVVTWTNEATTETTFGAVFGVSSITPVTTASAQVGGGGGGLRPLALCSAELPAVGNLDRVNFDGHNSDGGCDGLSGNWRSTDCPESDNNGTSQYIDAVTDGCSDPVHAVGGVPSGGETLQEHLLGACPPGNGASDEDCLGGNTGQVFSGQIPAAWEGLLDTRFTLPVICGPARCDPVAAAGSGNTAQYPVYRVAEVTLCGVHRKNQSASYGVSPECADADDEEGDGKDNWLVIRVHAILGPGDSPSPAVGGGSASLVR